MATVYTLRDAINMLIAFLHAAPRTHRVQLEPVVAANDPLWIQSNQHIDFLVANGWLQEIGQGSKMGSRIVVLTEQGQEIIQLLHRTYQLTSFLPGAAANTMYSGTNDPIASMVPVPDQDSVKPILFFRPLEEESVPDARPFTLQGIATKDEIAHVDHTVKEWERVLSAVNESTSETRAIRDAVERLSEEARKVTPQRSRLREAAATLKEAANAASSVIDLVNKLSPSLVYLTMAIVLMFK